MLSKLSRILVLATLMAGWVHLASVVLFIHPSRALTPPEHEITSGAYFDTFTSGTVPVTCPGSQFSARLGNSNGSAESERLRYSFVPPSDSLILALRFAVILENAAHPLSKQPRFGYEVTTTGGTLSGCTSEQIIAGDTNYNFSKNGIVEFLNWQIRYINLTGQSEVPFPFNLKPEIVNRVVISDMHT